MKKTLFFLITSLFMSCSDKILFTEKVKDELIKTGVNIQRLQFYNDSKFTLQKDLSDSKVEITSGKIKQLNGKKINIITFNSFTHGLVTSQSKNSDSLEVAFDEGQGKDLTFILDKKDHTYKLEDSMDQVAYSAEIYNMKSTYRIRLMISKSSLNSVKYDKTRAKGLKINTKSLN